MGDDSRTMQWLGGTGTSSGAQLQSRRVSDGRHDRRSDRVDPCCQPGAVGARPMAFTLAFHIILVPLGVSWAFMALIANYRGIKHGDTAALQLAQRWSKYMAVTFAVGAVTGTVLSFEFGLLWPRFMGQWGEAFGVPFAFEGIFFFTEAIFISIYIYGWRRLSPWAHFWTGVPVVLTGILGSVSVVAANAWMNSPEGFTLNSAGEVDRRRPVGGDLQRCDATDGRPHGHRRLRRRWVPDRLRLRGGDVARPPRPLSPTRVPDPFLRRRRRHSAADGCRRLVGPLGVQQPADQVRRDRARCGDGQRRSRDAAREAELRRRGHRRDQDPWLGVVAVGSGRRHEPRWSKGSTSHRDRRRPRCYRRTGRRSRRSTPSTSAWDVMVGLGTLLFLLVGLVLAVLDLPQGHAQEQAVLAHRLVRRRRGRSSVWRLGGWSARSAASRGSSTT